MYESIGIGKLGMIEKSRSKWIFVRKNYVVSTATQIFAQAILFNLFFGR